MRPQALASNTTRLNLSNTIEMVTHGTTSKTLIDDLGIKQIIFSMDADEEMSSHSSSYPATVHVLEGVLRFQLNGETFDLRANDWLMMPSGAKHSLKALTPMRFLLTLLKGKQAR
jgi:quercetin dioxygenase-like cupin family protein